MKKAVVVLSLALLAGIAVYLIRSTPGLPSSLPLLWGSESAPTSRAAFAGTLGALSGAVALAGWGVAWARPRAAWLLPLVLGFMFVFVYGSVRSAAGDASAGIPRAVALGALAASGIVSVFILIYGRRRPRRVQPF